MSRNVNPMENGKSKSLVVKKPSNYSIRKLKPLPLPMKEQKETIVVLSPALLKALVLVNSSSNQPEATSLLFSYFFVRFYANILRILPIFHTFLIVEFKFCFDYDERTKRSTSYLM